MHGFVQVNRQKTTVKKNITYFLKNYVSSLFTFSKKVYNLQIFYHLVFRCKVLRPVVFYLFEVQSKVVASSSQVGECVDSLVIFNKGREETFMASLQNCKSCVCIKYLTLVRPRKLIPWVLRFYTRCKMHRTPVLLKKYIAVILQLLNRSNFAFDCFFSQKFVHLKKILCHVFVYAMALTWTVHLMYSRICWSFS